MVGIFDLAIATLRADNHPVHLVRKALPPNKTKHKLALTFDEVGQIFRDLSTHGVRYETTCAFKLM